MLFRIGLNKFNILLIGLSLVSCKKEDNAGPSLVDGKSTLITDLAGDTRASMSNGIDGKEQRDFYTFLYDLEEKKQIWIRTKEDSLRWMKTDEWDLAFGGPYNSNWWINNRKQEGNPGYDGPVSNTAIVLLNQSYGSVTTAPSDADFDNSSITMVGQANDEYSPGWFAYNASTHIMRAYTNRTYALRLPNGKYAKLELLSAYKGNPPAVTDMFWPAPYLTFRYYIQQDGSKNLNTN